MESFKQLEDSKARRRDTGDPLLESLARTNVDAAYRVHAVLGPGLLEGVYEQCFAHELRKRGIQIELQKHIPIVYDGVRIESGLRIDVLVNDRVIVEIKAVENLLPVHKAQLLSYLRLAGKPLGFLINFHVPTIKEGIRRVVR